MLPPLSEGGVAFLGATGPAEDLPEAVPGVRVLRIVLQVLLERGRGAFEVALPRQDRAGGHPSGLLVEGRFHHLAGLPEHDLHRILGQPGIALADELPVPLLLGPDRAGIRAAEAGPGDVQLQVPVVDSYAAVRSGDGIT
ncbi:MAG: hypothetical protein A3Q59_00600 [Methanomethylophilus alvi]|nr:MAG: hypothetical protein A3Q59_00600 [Methanomethylophilus alvi]